MQYSGCMSGSAPVIKKLKASAAQLIGTVVIKSAAGASGQMSTSTTTSIANALGLVLDNGLGTSGTISYSTTQGAEEAVWGVIVNSDQILRAQMVTGATGTTITSDTIATASSNGLTAVTTGDPNSPDMDEGIIWYLTGANVGKSRKITSTAANTATVIVPFAANAVGDVVCYAGLNIGLQGCTTTTDLAKIRTDIADSTGAGFSIVDMELNGISDSYVHLMLGGNGWVQVHA